MLVTAGVGAEDLFASLFDQIQIVGYFISVGIGAKKDAIQWCSS
jgi:hypothetical protein